MTIFRFKKKSEDEWDFIAASDWLDAVSTLENHDVYPYTMEIVKDECWVGEASDQ